MHLSRKHGLAVLVAINWTGVGLLMRGKGFGCIGNILIGAVGGLIGGFLFRLVGVGE